MTTANAVQYWRSPLLPGADLLTATYRQHHFAAHWHDTYTVSVIEAGAERYDYRGARYVADAGCVPVLNPGEVHTGSPAMDGGWRYRVFYLPVECVQRVMDDLSGRPCAMPWFGDDILRDADLTRRLLAAHQTLQYSRDPLHAEHAFLDAVSLLLARHAGQRPHIQHLARDSMRVGTMKARLREELAEPLTLSELAGEVGLSTFHAARLFIRETGLAPHAWRNQLRLNRALQQLREGMAATDVASANGFADLSHFTRHFKKSFGVSPGRWVL
ncbi:MAG: HTH-type transcriptional regulator NimR [Pseudomonas sp.]|nr:MAG: HTH-type transcriptional regulator NimR [Pseudomonas sp.]